MKSDRLVVFGILLLAIGIWILFAFCQGSTGLNLGYPFSAMSFHIDLTTTGIPAMVGVPCVALGALLLVIAFFVALVSSFRPRDIEPSTVVRSRREIPFEE